MSPQQHDDLSRLADRVTELETLYMHLQRTVHELNDVVIQNRGQLDTLLGRVDRLVAIAAQGSVPGPEQDGDDMSAAG
jgi:uncharacterized coiled-coil protein SlyX